MQNSLIVVLGPTGIGKSNLAVRLAREFNTGIISADSRQFYREMKIGTAVPPESDLKSVKHYFIQHIPVTSYYSASRFEQDALGVLEKEFRDKKIMIMAGGSGLYIDAVCGSIDNIPDINPAVRDLYLSRLEKEGLESLRAELGIIDPEYYKSTDIRNKKRILRALEVFGSTGRPYSSFLGKGGKRRDFNIVKIGLNCERDILYGIINKRVDCMIDEGLLEEAKTLFPSRQLNALNTVGYRELFEYLEGKTDLESAIELIKRNTRRYAKRQLTYWARDKEIRWFEPHDTEGIISFIRFSTE